MINPLEVLEELAVNAVDERTRVTAAKSLAEYTHSKRPPSGSGVEAQQVNIVMLIGEDNSKQPKLVE